MTIEEFIAARLAEDEALAKAAAERSDDWQARGGAVVGGPFSGPYFEGDEPMAEHTIVYDEGWPLDTEAQHIARHDPASVLLRVAPLRELLEFYAEVRHIWQGDYLKADFTLGKLASIWRGHPDYRPEWNA